MFVLSGEARLHVSSSIWHEAIIIQKNRNCLKNYINTYAMFAQQ